jgi:hypothetical protein
MNEEAERHRQRMARHKERVDRRIAAAREDRGVLVVLTGAGKGKSTSAFGMVARAVGHGMRCGVVYFMKSRETGEEQMFQRLPEVEVRRKGAGFTWETQDGAVDRAAPERAWVWGRSSSDGPTSTSSCWTRSPLRSPTVCSPSNRSSRPFVTGRPASTWSRPGGGHRGSSWTRPIR